LYSSSNNTIFHNYLIGTPRTTPTTRAPTTG